MSKKHAKKESGKATLAGVKKEMAKPRMAKSARKEEVNQAAVRVGRGKRMKTKARNPLGREDVESHFKRELSGK
jgi:hypothetical protein